MVRLVEFSEPAASLIRLVEDTDPENMVDVAVKRLREGATPDAMLTAAGLAVSCSTELPPGHHGGPVHPVSGLYAAGELTKRLSGEQAFLPAVQSVALANKHIHTAYMGPGAMPVLDIDSLRGQSKDALATGLAEALDLRQAALAERHLLALLEVASPGEIMEVLLGIALPRNSLDDHYLLYPIFAFRALDELGWEHAPVLLRPPIRYLARHPQLDHESDFESFYEPGIRAYKDPEQFSRLARERGIVLEQLAVTCEGDEAAAIEALADRIGRVDHLAEVPEFLLDALVAGLSLEGAGEALSVGGARLFLRSSTGNPFDVHVHTGINARRYLIRMAGLSTEAKALSLLGWAAGPEVSYIDESLAWPLDEDPEPIDVDAEASQASLLEAITASIYAMPELDLRELPVSIEKVRLPESARRPIALATRYARLGYDPEALFHLTAALVCRDDQSEMHAYKLQQAAYEEYHDSPALASHRWVHLVSAVKHVACVTQIRPQDVHEQAAKALSH